MKKNIIVFHLRSYIFPDFRRMFRPGFIVVFLFINLAFGIGTDFLTVPSTARELALGANPVIAVTPTANPALLGFGSLSRMSTVGTGPELSLSYGSWLADVQETTIGATGQLRKGMGGLRIRYMGLEDLELRKDRPVDTPLAHFGAHGVSLDGTYSRKVGATNYGVTLRMAHIQLYTETSRGYAFDFGVVHRIQSQAIVGLAVLNMGSMSSLDRESPRLPFRLIGGAAYFFDMEPVINAVSLTAEWSSQVQQVILRIGNEIRWNKLNFQIGTCFSEKVVTVSGGIGIRLGIYRLQYGVQVGSQDLGIPQMMDVSVRLP